MMGGGVALGVASVLLAVLPPASAGDGDADARADSRTLIPGSSPAGPDLEPLARPRGAGSAAISGDDPLAAAVALLERRDECIAELSLLCLEEVDQQGSAALADDRAGLKALRAGDEARLEGVVPVEPALLERLGDSALVRVGPDTAPASLLLVKSEAGWRIRDWVAVD